MKKHIAMGSIPQFREVVRNVKHQATYVGKNDDGNAIYDNSKELPTITFRGYEKLHGTQGSCCFNNIDDFWVQSKANIITPEKDNNACAFNAYAKRDAWIKIILDLAHEYKIDLYKNTISVFFEWCGGNIQKSSAASGLDKRAVIFRYFKVSPFDLDDDNPAYWLETEHYDLTNTLKNVSDNENNIFNIADFPSVTFDVDFNNHEVSQKAIMDVILENEEHSPFGKVFGKDSNILEGYVLQAFYKGILLQFKSKGDKHSKSKVKVQKTYSPEELEKLDNAKKCADEIFSHQRCNQALTELFGPNDEDVDIKRMGEYLKWVSKDTLKEESDIISDYGLEPKDVMKYVQEQSKKYFFGIIKK